MAGAAADVKENGLCRSASAGPGESGQLGAACPIGAISVNVDSGGVGPIGGAVQINAERSGDGRKAGVGLIYAVVIAIKLKAQCSNTGTATDRRQTLPGPQ